MDLNPIFFRLIQALFTVLGACDRKTALFFSRVLGSLFYAVDRRHRKIARDNLTLAFGREMTRAQIRQTARKVFQNLVLILFELGWSLRLDDKTWARHFRVSGKQHLDEALAHEKGILFLTGHVGNWELLEFGGLLAKMSIGVIYRPIDFEPMDRFIKQCRTRFGAFSVPTSRSMRKILKGLNQGRHFVVLLDQSVDWYEGVYVDFFGRRTCTNKGLALLARKTGAPVLPIFLIRDKKGFIIKFLPEVPFVRSKDKTKDLECHTQAYNRVIEAVIREHPDQWFWVHRRWKKRPYEPWPRQKPGKR